MAENAARRAEIGRRVGAEEEVDKDHEVVVVAQSVTAAHTAGASEVRRIDEDVRVSACAAATVGGGNRVTGFRLQRLRPELEGCCRGAGVGDRVDGHIVAPPRERHRE